MGFLKSISGSLRRAAKIGTEGMGDENYNIGDIKQFPDGSERVLGYSKAGVRRWLTTKEAQEQELRNPGGQNAEIQAPDVLLDEMPTEIIVDEWNSYNQYLTTDNPFIHCLTYGQMEKEWFAFAYEFNSRLDIVKDDPERVKNVEKKMDLLDKYFLALQMYKVGCLLFQIMKLQPDFDYKSFVKENGWQELVDYLEQIKMPSEVDYTGLHEDIEDSSESEKERVGVT